MGPNHNVNKCVQCDFEFSSWEEHRNHVLTTHSNVWKYKCGFCDKIFDSVEDANSHKKVEHPSDKTIKKQVETTCCYVCGKEMQASHLQVNLRLNFWELIHQI